MSDRVEGLVSTVIPVFNRAALLHDAVASVLAQTWPHVELVIVDDGSTDDTRAAADAIASRDPDRVRVLAQPNAGPAAARQRGLEAARGEFVQFLDSDDLLAPRKFELQVTGLRAHPACGVSYGKSRRYRIGDVPCDVAVKLTGRRIDRLFPALLASRWWTTSTPLFRRSVCDAAGPWCVALRNEEDWEYECRVAALGTRLHYVPEFVSDQRDHDLGQLHATQTPAAEKLRHRAHAHALILAHAQRAGLGADVPEMCHFARELFLLARQCGALGLTAQSEQLFTLAREASTTARRRGLDFRLYRLAAAVIGWHAAGRLAALTDRWRGG